MNAPMTRSAAASVRAGTSPVFVVGAGAIVRDAHIPAYAKAGIPIAGIFDLDARRARTLAGAVGARLHASMAELAAAARASGGVLDLALPPQALAATLAALPEGSVVLAQKPFGRDLAEATELLRIASERRLCGAVNFQLRHAPAVVALRSLLASGAIGEPLDLEIRVVCSMPWETWRFLDGMPRMEVLMHSIHYLDLARALFGEPDRVWCATARHPAAPALADTRSTSVLSFGAERRAVVTTFHHHRAPERHDASHLRIEGTRGTAVVRLGVNLDYPRGRRDTLEWSADGGPWREEPVAGDWFPDAFAGSMRALQRFAVGESTVLESSFADAWRTMALVETCYKSAAAGERPPGAPAL
jgi:predicted dehydrogenase